MSKLSELQKLENVRNNFDKVIRHYLYVMLNDIKKHSKVEDNKRIINEDIIIKFEKEVCKKMDTLKEFEKYLTQSLINYEGDNNG